MKEMITVSNISYKVKAKTIIDNVSFAVNNGDSFALLGENGAGKSTLIDIILDDLKPNNGKVTFFGNKNSNFDKVGIVYDHLPLFPLLKVAEIIKYFTVIHKLNYTTVKEQYFETFDIEKIKNSYIKELSQGEKKKIGLLLSIIHEPNLLILDEPFANLDPTIIDRIWRSLKQGNRTIFFTTHDWKDVEKIATKIGFIFEGRLMKEPKSPKEILATLPANKKIIISNESEIVKTLKTENNKFYKHDEELHIFFDKETNLLGTVSSHTTNFSIQDVGLKDAYLYYTNNLSL